MAEYVVDEQLFGRAGGHDMIRHDHLRDREEEEERAVMRRLYEEYTAETDATQIYQAYLDKSTPFTTYRWIGSGVVFFLFAMRIVFAQGWYIGACFNPSISTYIHPSIHPSIPSH